MQIPKDAQLTSYRSANSKRPPQIERDLDFGDGYSPRSARFGAGDERYTLALASRVKLDVESRKDEPAAAGESYSKIETPESTTYTSIHQIGNKLQAAVALFQEESGQVSVSQYSWQA